MSNMINYKLFLNTPVGVLNLMNNMFEYAGITSEEKQYQEMLTASMIANFMDTWSEPELNLKSLLLTK